MEHNNSTDQALQRALEFYSGIGGLHYGLRLSGWHGDVVQAFDINTNANDLYRRNFKQKVNQKSIESLSPVELDQHNARMWLLSPPCQPYTRIGKQRDTEDQRAQSFLHLIKILPKLQKPPMYILIENVKGFEISETRRLLIEQFKACDYHFQEFHLTPNQFGIPNSRLRYFCLARRNKPFEDVPVQTDPCIQFIPNSSYFDAQGNSTKQVRPLSDFLEELGDEQRAELMVPENILLKAGMLFDIAFPDSPRSCCFTKAYGRYVEGTGSVFQLAEKEIKAVEGDAESLKKLQLRYFSPREIANIHGFPKEEFDLFEKNFTRKQLYSLLGNSLNVLIVSELIKYLVS
jgi:tRNA (cytosine38-C5)-methyltransferase